MRREQSAQLCQNDLKEIINSTNINIDMEKERLEVEHLETVIQLGAMGCVWSKRNFNREEIQT